LDASPYLGRLALCRVFEGTIRQGQQIAWCHADGSIERAKVTELYVSEALDRVSAEEAGPGELIAVAGIPEVTIGETLADPDDPRPLPATGADAPRPSPRLRLQEAEPRDDDRDQHLSPLRPRRRQADREHGQGAARPG